jgi:hypothetical protein
MTRTLLLVMLLATTLSVAAEDSETAPIEGSGDSHERTEEPPDGEATQAQDGQASKNDGKGAKLVSGMSILGNQEAPKSLIIVPWKSSELGNFVGITTMLDDSKRPVDRDVFLRALSYYEIRKELTP